MAEAVDGIPNLGVGQGKKKRCGQPEAERKRVCIASAAQEKWTCGIFLLCVFQTAFIRLVRLTQGGAINPYGAWSGSSVEVWCRSTFPLQISDTRAVHLVTAGNDRGGLRDRSRRPELECVAYSNCCFFVIGRIANFLMGKIEPALLLCMILGKLFGAKAASASDNS